MRTILMACIALGLASGEAKAQPGLTASDKPSCTSSVGTLNFVCGVVDPEDLARVPGTRWLVASGYDPGGGLLAGAGLKLVDTDAKTFTSFYLGLPAQSQPNRKRYPFCADAPDPHKLVTHGLYLRPDSVAKNFTLYAVAHSPRETIEIFTVKMDGAVPALSWNGCVPMPASLKGNAVAAFSDGTILATVLGVPGRKTAAGLSAGAVLQWKPGDPGFQILPGTDLPSDNGIEISKDGSEFYVIGFGDATVSVFSRADTSKPLRSVKAPGFVPDNLRWSGALLIGTGPMVDEPACGGTRAQAAQLPSTGPRRPGGGCNRGYIAAALDPATMQWKILAYGEPNPQIGIIRPEWS